VPAVEHAVHAAWLMFVVAALAVPGAHGVATVAPAGQKPPAVHGAQPVAPPPEDAERPGTAPSVPVLHCVGAAEPAAQ